MTKSRYFPRESTTIASDAELPPAEIWTSSPKALSPTPLRSIGVAVPRRAGCANAPVANAAKYFTSSALPPTEISWASSS